MTAVKTGRVSGIEPPPHKGAETNHEPHEQHEKVQIPFFRGFSWFSRLEMSCKETKTDLVYYGYRYYSPALGRWLSRDPIEEQGGLNLYAFVNNDPVNKWDVLGLSLMDQGKRFVKGVGKRIFGDGKLCVHKNCEGVDLSRLTYVPENISKNTPAGERLKSLPSPGNCVAADALYFPGGA